MMCTTALACALGGCGTDAPVDPDAPFTPVYNGAVTRALDAELVQIIVKMDGARDGYDVTAYARCAAAGYASKRGAGFARHLRTKVDEEGGAWSADAVYTISPTRPAGRALDVGLVVSTCAELGIPTV
jgi:hypothetical protein